MPRSPRAQSLLLATVAVLLLVTGGAFAATFGSQLTWQQRDAVAVSVEEYAVVTADGAPAVRVRLAVENPLDRPIEVRDPELVVYEGEPPFEDDRELTVPRTASMPDTVVPADGERTVAVTMAVAENGNGTDRARAAVDGGNASASGLVAVRLVGREFSVDV